MLEPRAVARAQGAFNSVNGLWPLLHLRSFEAVFGRKTDHWLVRTVAGFLLVVGLVQLTADTDAPSLRLVRRIGVGTSLVLGTIDVIYAPRRRISRLYLLDAAAEAALVTAWALARGAAAAPARRRARRRRRR
ncbi:hypothetical protein GCM10022286_09620 [Gryllotalpicola daejeonensis]|uniref:DUF4345 domain-containing protein n=1 Tax=Gryllotalpicola daejeonensis TaxID=993087 RepID=A0ABP7ZHD5_9MICO